MIPDATSTSTISTLLECYGLNHPHPASHTLTIAVITKLSAVAFVTITSPLPSGA